MCNYDQSNILTHKRNQIRDGICVLFDPGNRMNSESHTNQGNKALYRNQIQKPANNDGKVSQEQEKTVNHNTRLFPLGDGEMLSADFPVRFNIRKLI